MGCFHPLLIDKNMYVCVYKCRGRLGNHGLVVIETSPVVQWFRIHLPKQGARVPSLV